MCIEWECGKPPLGAVPGGRGVEQTRQGEVDEGGTLPRVEARHSDIQCGSRRQFVDQPVDSLVPRKWLDQRLGAKRARSFEKRPTLSRDADVANAERGFQVCDIEITNALKTAEGILHVSSPRS